MEGINDEIECKIEDHVPSTLACEWINMQMLGMVWEVLVCFEGWKIKVIPAFIFCKITT